MQGVAAELDIEKVTFGKSLQQLADDPCSEKSVTTGHKDAHRFSPGRVRTDQAVGGAGGASVSSVGKGSSWATTARLAKP